MSTALNADPRKMDTKAANSGDRMKHPLTQEVLIRTDKWDSVTYAETHTGAGIYLAKHQPEDKFILDLREKVAKHATILANSGEPIAGSAYFKLLRNWWSQERLLENYPGGALQAALALQDRREVGSFQLRLTEYDSTTCQRLEDSLQDFSNAEIRESSFCDEREWLVQEDSLVLVVDPFRCVVAFNGSRSAGLNDGHIDHQVVSEFLADCESKKAAVLHFWWPSRSQNGGGELDKLLCKSQRLVRELFSRWESDHSNRTVREFSNHPSPHRSFLVGVGLGAELVEDLPSKSDWKNSWLAGDITESSKYREVRKSTQRSSA